MTETRLISEHGRTALRIERPLRHPPAKVWRALTQPSELNQWFPFDVEPELRVGGAVRFVDKAGGASSSGVITDFDPPRLIAYTWADDHLRWELRPTPEGCLLVLTHTVADRCGTASFATGWNVCIDALECVVAGRPAPPPPGRAEMAATHERLLTRFGLVDGEVADTESGWLVRFERQLVQPADTAWRLLLGDTGAPEVGGPAPAGAVAPRLVAGRVTEASGAVPGLAAGRVTEVEPNRVLEYEWLADGRAVGRVRWRLGAGTGQGARLVLTQAGPADRPEWRDAALAGWREHIERFATELVDTLRAPAGSPA
jgi:uncharacterized protein YndB with AHSA1/START domain